MSLLLCDSLIQWPAINLLLIIYHLLLWAVIPTRFRRWTCDIDEAKEKSEQLILERILFFQIPSLKLWCLIKCKHPWEGLFKSLPVSLFLAAGFSRKKRMEIRYERDKRMKKWSGSSESWFPVLTLQCVLVSFSLLQQNTQDRLLWRKRGLFSLHLCGWKSKKQNIDFGRTPWHKTHCNLKKGITCHTGSQRTTQRLSSGFYNNSLSSKNCLHEISIPFWGKFSNDARPSTKSCLFKVPPPQHNHPGDQASNTEAFGRTHLNHIQSTACIIESVELYLPCDPRR